MATQNTKVRRAYRQGELVFLPLNAEDIATLEPGAKNQCYSRWKKLRTTVLREGEATGHKHEVVTQARGTATLLEPAQGFMPRLPDMGPIGVEDRLLVAEQPVVVVHPEHRSLRLPKGDFLVVVQREYDELKARRIMD